MRALRHQQLSGSAAATPYRSPACRIGSHADCTESEPTEAPADLPLVYETCVCSCHLRAVEVPSKGAAHG